MLTVCYKNKIWRCGALLLSFFLLLSGCSPRETDAPSPLGAYDPVSIDNEWYSLDLTDEGQFRLTDKSDGRTIGSWPENLTGKTSEQNQVKSALCIQTYLEGTDGAGLSYSYVSSVLKDGLTVRREEKELIAEYYFEMDQITVPVHYTLSGKRLLVTILPEEIREDGAAKVMEISLHPYFGSGREEDEGFLLVPDGSGAIIEFHHQGGESYRQKVYGNDESLYSFTARECAQPSVMPVFGTAVRGDGVYFGIISGGEADAYVEAVAGNTATTYNAAYATFHLLPKDVRYYPDDYRLAVDIVSEQRKDTGPLQVTYCLQREAEPTYMDMAELYQDYLTERYGLTRLTDGDYPLVLDITMATVKRKTALGIPYQGVEVLTSSRQAEDMIDYFGEQGISTVVRLHRWSRETVWQKLPGKVTRLSPLGTGGEWDSLLAAAQKNGKVYLSTGLSVVNDNGLWNRHFVYAQSLQNAAVPLQQYHLVTKFREDDSPYLLSNRSVLSCAKRLCEAFSGKIGSDVGVSLEDLSILYTDFSADNKSLTATKGTYTQALKQFEDAGRSVGVSDGCQFSLGAADFIFEMPASDSKYDLVDYGIPFYQIVLHGYLPYANQAVNASADPQKEMLKALESGALLSFRMIGAQAEAARYSQDDDLYNSTFDGWKEIAAQAQTAYRELLSDKQTQRITDHRRLAEGVFYTQYEDGDAVVVNYTEQAYSYAGLSVAPMGFAQVKGGGAHAPEAENA